MFALKIYWWKPFHLQLPCLQTQIFIILPIFLQFKLISAPSAGWQQPASLLWSAKASHPLSKHLHHSWLSCPLSSIPRAQHSEPNRALYHSMWGLGSTHINNYRTFSLRVLHRIYLLTHLRKIIMIHSQFLLPWSFSTARVMTQLFPE